MDTMRTIVPQVRAEYPSLERTPDRYVDDYRQAMPRTLQQWIAWIRQGFQVQRTRRALRGLTDDELRDIGLRPDQAAREAGRPIWDRGTHFSWWG